MLCQAVIALPPHRIVLPVRCMDRSFLYIQRGLPQRFGDGGMTMNGRDQFIHRGLQSDGQRALGNEVCGSWSYDMHTQNFAVFRSGDELYQTLSAIEDQCLSVGTHGELTHLVCDTTLIDGTNASDDAGDRPGMQALRELKVYSPLRDCGLTKADVRRLSKEAGLFTWNKPAYACLATRIPAETPITPEDLARTEKAEDYLSSLGFTDFRVRQMGNAAKLQLPDAQLAHIVEAREQIVTTLKQWYSTVLLDLEVRDE